MPYLLNIIYLLSLLVFSPWLVYKALTTSKYRRGLWQKVTGRVVPLSASSRHPAIPSSRHPVAWFHGVSVGEVHLLRPLVATFRARHPEWTCVISSTTDTGIDEARRLFADLGVFYWPLDFSWAVERALRRVNPSLVVLAEGELWPTFLKAASKRGVPVAVVNARMSPGSFRRYRRLRFLARPAVRFVSLVTAQTEEYAAHYRELGCLPERVHATGSVKFDGALTDRDNPRTRQLREQLGLAPGDLVWIAGSTQDPEEEIVLRVYRRLKPAHPNLRLVIVPRQKDRFDAVADLLERTGQCYVRRSGGVGADAGAVILVDTIGELGALWGLADVAFVGGSLDGRRGGQNMIEPAAFGAAVVFGPHVWNFEETASRLVAAGGAITVADATGLEAAVCRLLAHRDERNRLGAAGRRFVLAQQGATARTVALLTTLITAGGPPWPSLLYRQVG